MQKRRLGRSDPYLTPLGLGTWAIGGPWAYGWGPQDDAESMATIGRALDLGIGWIDTAPAYGLGHAETLVGQAIRGRRDEMVIATKCGLIWDDPAQGRVTNRLTAASIEKEAEDSLRRLGIKAIDLYQIQWPSPDAGLEEAWEAMARLVERGKVCHAGLSNFSLGQLRRAQALHAVTSLQPPYSLLDRAVEAELLPYCAAHGIGVVAYGPLTLGLVGGPLPRGRGREGRNAGDAPEGTDAGANPGKAQARAAPHAVGPRLETTAPSASTTERAGLLDSHAAIVML